MTQSLARLLALPFVLYLIYFFSVGGYDISEAHTLLLLISVLALVLLYVFQHQVNIWWWKKRPPRLPKKLLSWITHHNAYFTQLSPQDQLKLEQRIALFIKLKTFTLKVEKDYEVEEDVKALLALEFQKLVFNHQEYLYEDYDQIIFYNHPFPTPTIQTLHALEIHDEDGVIILSKEQMVNGILDPDQINIAMLAAIMTFVRMNPRLDFPDVSEISLEEIATKLGIQLDSFEVILGQPWIKKLELLVYAYVEMPKKLETWNNRIFSKLQDIFA